MIQLFHAGTSHVINGITCERQTVNEFGFEHFLEEGWFFTPEECYPKETPEKLTLKEVPKKVQETPKTADSKVTALVTPMSDKTPKVGKSDKTTTKTAVKK